MSTFFATWLLIHAIDYHQTTYIVKHPDRYAETNVLLGKHPSRGSVNTLFIATTGLVYTLDTHLPKRYDYARGILIGLTFTNAARNVTVLKRF